MTVFYGVREARKERHIAERDPSIPHKIYLSKRGENKRKHGDCR